MIIKKYVNGRLVSEEVNPETTVRRSKRQKTSLPTPSLPKTEKPPQRTPKPLNTRPRKRKLGGCGCGKRKRK